MSFRLNHPQSFALDPNPVHIAGFGTAFEGEAQVRIMDGHDEKVQLCRWAGRGRSPSSRPT
jgi:hypothetical protein